jgi:predicted TIM-barrel fold metal-dependent hydrolase
MIDTNVYLSRWLFRRVPCDDTTALVARLKEKGVARAWAGSFDALLHRDLAAVNARLAEECRSADGFLLPFGAVNPTQPDWREDVRRCAEVHGMRGIRLHPNYHGYTLTDSLFGALLEEAQRRSLIVQIALRMEDPRTQHPRVQVKDVDATPLLELLPKFPKLRVQLLNALNVVRPDSLDKLLSIGQVYIEPAMLEGVAGIERLLAHIPHERLLFGSYFPFFAFESAQLKLQESALSAAQRTAISSGNAERFWQAGE